MARRPAPARLLYVSAGSRDRAQGIAFVCSCEPRDSVTPAPRRPRIAPAPRSSRASRRASRARGDRRSPRPAPAIRAGATDGNSKTEGDVNFATLLPTPCFPSHPSNHASGSNAAAETVRRIYGAAGHSITLSAAIAVIGQESLSYTSLKQITNDVDDARI